MLLLKLHEALARGGKALSDRAIVTRAAGISQGGYVQRQKEAADDEEAARILNKLAADPRLIDQTIAELAQNPEQFSLPTGDQP